MIEKNNILVLIFGILTVLSVGMTVVGAFLCYSPIPWADMWDGYLHFFLRVSEGETSVWWAQHNEHRIVLARVLFWMDIKWFDGMGWFLIAVNYFLVGISVWVFLQVLFEASAMERERTSQIILGLFITAWLFLWVQHENLVWAFQSQFILAQLLPLCAFYWLHKASVGKRHWCYFLIACGFGVASVGTMANGVIVLPLMILYALLTRQGLRSIGVLIMFSGLTLFLYFYNYHAPTQHGSFLLSLRENPFSLLQYTLLYLGSPFYSLFGKGGLGKAMAYLSSAMFIGSSAWFTFKILHNPKQRTLELAMLFFIAYILSTALGTAGGRLFLGVDQALSSRYTTPVLMAWTALLILYLPVILATTRTKTLSVIFAGAVLVLLIIPFQRKALQPQDSAQFERKIAALALELQVKDQKQIRNVFLSVEPVLNITQQASFHNISIFGTYPFLDMKEKLNALIQRPVEEPQCKGYLDSVEVIDGETAFVRVNGWIFDSSKQTVPQVVRFLNNQNHVVGYALTGQARNDAATLIDKKALKAGYRGYLLSGQTGELTLQGENPSCQMRVKISP